MTRVVLVRHAQSSWNVRGLIQGRSDHSVLSEQGQEQALATAQFLRDLPFDSAWSSPLMRARQTTQAIVAAHPGLTIQTSPLLQEIHLPAWEGLTMAQVAERFPEQHRHWQETPEQLELDHRHPVVDLWEQASHFWQELLTHEQGKSILIVGHNGINKALLATALGLPPSHYTALLQSNGGVSVLNFDASGYAQLESMNLTAHTGQVLPAYKRAARLLLVRHGETDWNREERFQGQIDVPLNAQGQLQAERVAEFLQQVPIERAFSSPLLRPKATALQILGYHPQVELQLVPDLQEICHGQWEGKFRAEVEALFPGMLDQWSKTPHQVQMPEGENLAQVWERSLATWRGIVEQTKAVSLVVAHDAINKAVISGTLGLGPEEFWRFRQGNGSVTVIDYPQGVHGQARLSAMNITSHLGGVLDCTAAGAL
ncbi:MAG: histidine phosphatase family protein [Gemmatimonadaceae bacterium]|nr:histidine phosphatase family protein [Gloeobacterales cyanobacterium ES-bin-141]